MMQGIRLPLEQMLWMLVINFRSLQVRRHQQVQVRGFDIEAFAEVAVGQTAFVGVYAMA